MEIMHPADKAKLKQLYVEETGESVPETDIEYFLHDLARGLGRREYWKLIESLYSIEPDAIAINNYIEWLEEKVSAQNPKNAKD